MTAQVRIDPNGNEAQEAFVTDTNAETAYIGGVGSGKTVAGIMRTARHIFEWNPGEMLAVVSPTVPMLRNVIVPEMRKWGLLGQPGIDYHRSENRIDYPNDTTVVLESANNDRKIERLRGLNLAAAWVDEVGEHQHKTYKILGDRLRTGSYRNLFVTGTPKGYNWVHDEFVDFGPTHERSVSDGRLVRDDHTTTIVGVSTEANPANPADYIQSRKRQHTGQSYRQEIEGEFVQFEGLVYPWFDDQHIANAPPETYDEVIFGVDWGHNNPAVVLATVRDGDRWIVVDEWYQRRCTVNDHARAAEDLVGAWGEGPIYCDPSEPANIETFQRNGLPARAADNDVTPGIQQVAAIRDRLCVVSSCQNLRNEFNQYQYKDGGDADAPLKQHDHALDSLRYQIFTHIRQPNEQQDSVWYDPT